MSEDAVPAIEVTIAYAISDLTGLPVEDLQSYTIVYVNRDDQVGTISTSESAAGACAWLAAGIFEMLTRPVPDIVVIPPN